MSFDAAPDPRLEIQIDGVALAPEAFDQLTGLTISRRWNAPASAELIVDVGDSLRAFAVTPGSQLDISAGDGVGLFSGEIVRMSRSRDAAGETLTVTAYDALANLETVQTRGSRDIGSIIGFARALAEPTGLAVDAAVADFSAGRQLQREQDDLAFLTKTLRRYGLGVAVTPSGLRVARIGDPVGAAIDVTAAIVRSSVTEEPRLASEPMLTGWTVQDDQTVSARPALARSLRGPNGVALSNDEPADEVLARERAHRNLSARTFQAELIGCADMRPGDAVANPDDGPPFALTDISIIVDGEAGFRTFIASKPPPAPAPEPMRVYGGVVERIGDPSSGGRVRVAINGFEGALTGWIPVLAAGHGFAAPYRVGDPVLVAAPEGDPERGGVLGGLVRPGGPQADLTPGETRRGMAWRGDGLSVTLDEADGRLSLALDSGAHVSVVENAISLELEGRASVALDGDDVSIRAPGRLDLDCDGGVRIRGSRIDFEEA